MTQYKQYRVSIQAFDTCIVDARTEKEAIRKAKKKLKLSSHIEVETRNNCATSGCPNLVEFSIGGMPERYCSTCRYNHKQDRLNSPG